LSTASSASAVGHVSFASRFFRIADVSLLSEHRRPGLLRLPLIPGIERVGQTPVPVADADRAGGAENQLYSVSSLGYTKETRDRKTQGIVFK
jgi:hypothetical protein